MVPSDLNPVFVNNFGDLGDRAEVRRRCEADDSIGLVEPHSGAQHELIWVNFRIPSDYVFAIAEQNECQGANIFGLDPLEKDADAVCRLRELFVSSAELCKFFFTCNCLLLFSFNGALNSVI